MEKKNYQSDDYIYVKALKTNQQKVNSCYTISLSHTLYHCLTVGKLGER